MAGEAPTLDDLAQRARSGERAALDELVGRLTDDVYRLVLRLVGDPQDAQDATQEVLVKVLEHLDGFRGESGVRTWVWSIATHHVASFRRGRRETVSFEALDDMLDQGLAAEAVLGPPPDDPVLESEVMLGCTTSMVQCLDREQRAAFVLGAVLDLPGAEAADILGIDAATYRKRLSRARTRMKAFMERRCGLVDEEAPCRCSRQVTPSLQAGVVDPDHLVFTSIPVRQQSEVQEAHETVRQGERYLEVLRRHPEYVAPETLKDAMRRIVARL